MGENVRTVKVYYRVDDGSFGKHLNFEFSPKNGVHELRLICAELGFQFYILRFNHTEGRKRQSVGTPNFEFPTTPLPKKIVSINRV